MSTTIHPCLWFNGNAKEAATFYCAIFKNSRIITDTPMVVNWELDGKRFMGLNGGPNFTFSEAVSMVVECDNQEEIDHYWDSLIKDGGQESRCGWLKDKFGFSWQIIPRNIGSYISNPETSDRAMQALLKMKKIIIADLENA